MAAETYLIGITGPSGAGKTCLAGRLAAALPARVIALDRYYRDLSHLPAEQRAAINFDAPQSLEHELLIAQSAQLRKGETILLPGYDFATHTRSREAEPFAAESIVILEGLFTLYWPELRDLLDMKVYVDAPGHIALARRKQRDVRERGRTPQSIEEQYAATVAPMAERYLLPAKTHADLVVRGDGPIEEAVTQVLAHYRRQVSRRQAGD